MKQWAALPSVIPVSGVTNPRGFATTTSYQAWDMPTTECPTLVAMPEGVYTHLTRDQFGKPERIQRSDNATLDAGMVKVDRSYTYNGLEELCRVIDPETDATLMGYDAAGNLAWSASGLAASTACSSTGNETLIAQRKAVRTYDARNRVTSLSFPDLNGNQSWTYTPDGLPETVTTYNDGGATTVVNSYAYNKRRLPTSESSAQPGWYTFTAGYGYDGNGNLASLNRPGFPGHYGLAG